MDCMHGCNAAAWLLDLGRDRLLTATFDIQAPVRLLLHPPMTSEVRSVASIALC